MRCQLELVVLPVSDVDRAKHFYMEQIGFGLQVDHRAGEDFRVVHLVPPGSACSIALMANPQKAGTLEGLHLSVPDIEAARAELVSRGTKVSDFFHFVEGRQVPGIEPQRRDYNSFSSFVDPDGNAWMVQEIAHHLGEPRGA